MKVKGSVGWGVVAAASNCIFSFGMFTTHRHERLNACVRLPCFLSGWGACVAGEKIMILELELS